MLSFNKLQEMFTKNTSRAKKKKVSKKSTINKTGVIELYGVFPSDDSNTILSIVSSMEEASEVVQYYTYYNNYDHFKNWYTLNYGNKDVNTQSSLPFLDSEEWAEFMGTCLDPRDPKNLFNIAKMYFTPSDVASIFRMFHGCAPLDYSFIKEEEEPMYITTMDPYEYDDIYLKFLEHKGVKVDQMFQQQMKEFMEHMEQEVLGGKDSDKNKNNKDDDDISIDPHTLN